MRPKLFSLFAVSALALAGCSGAEPTVQPTATVTVTATPSADAEPSKETKAKASAASASPSESLDPGSPVDMAGLSFFRYARVQAPIAGDHDKVDQSAYTEALNDFCLEGEPIDVSEVKQFNEQLEDIAETRFCEAFEGN